MNAGGSGGTNGTSVALTVSGGTCTTQPVLLGTISGGALIAITGVQTAGACPLTTEPNAIATVTGNSLSGATVNLVMAKNALALAGGSGSGATATISTQGSSYRPGVGLYVHGENDGIHVAYAEFEGYQTQVEIQNSWSEILEFVGGEGVAANADHQMFGVDLEGCVKDVTIYKPTGGSDSIGLKLTNHPNGVGGSCGYGASTNPTIISPQLGYTNGITTARILTGTGSTGTIIGAQLYTAYPWPAGVQIGPNSGVWNFSNIQWANGAQPPIFGQWISVDPTASPPTSDQYAWIGRGSLIDNGDMLVDQVAEGASNGNALRIDRWRWTNSATGATTSAQRLTSGPRPYSYFEQLTVSSSATPPAASFSYLAQNIEGPSVAALGWGATANAQPAVLDWCAKASVAGTYSLFLKNSSESYVHPFTLTSTNVTQCFATVVPAPPVAFATSIGSIGLVVGFDAGSGVNNQTANTDAWQAAAVYEASGAVQLITNIAATLSVGAVHLRPGPFIAPYQARDYATELGIAQRFYQKSFGAGTAVGQNKGAAGAVTTTTPFTSGAASAAVRFGTGMVASPTVTLYNTNAANTNCYDASKSADVGAASAINVGTTGFTAACSLSSGSPAVGDLLQVQWSADAGI